MNIEGLDYNTARKNLLMPEYGREIQMLVDFCKTIENREIRQQCAEEIVNIMKMMSQTTGNSATLVSKLWDHLAILSNFELEIDYPFEVATRDEYNKKPEPLKYPMQNIKKRHYGHLIEGLFDKLKSMPAGEERDELVRLTANQMQRSLFVWNRGAAGAEKIVDDLARYTNGVIQVDVNQLDLQEFDGSNVNTSKGKKKKK